MPVRVLLADENLAVQKLIELTLNKQGIEVTTTDNGLSALDIAIKNPPDVILADYKLEGLDIATFIQKTKKREQLADIPIILLVNSTETHDPVYLQSIGAETFFKKPIDTEELIKGIKKLTSSADAAFDLSHEVSNPDESDLSQHFTSSEDESKTISEMLGWSTENEVQASAVEAEDDEQTVFAPTSADDFFQDENKGAEQNPLESDSLEDDQTVLSVPSDSEGLEALQASPFEDQNEFSESKAESDVLASKTEGDPFSFPFNEEDPFSQPEQSFSPEAHPSLDEQTILPPIASEAIPSTFVEEEEEVQSGSFEETHHPEPEHNGLAHQSEQAEQPERARENGAALDDKIMKAVLASTEKILKDLLPDLVKASISKEMVANIVEEVTWEAVTPLAEAEIKKAIKQLQAESGS